MRAMNNERGGATLLYVLMVMLILMVLAPVVLNATSNEAARDTADTNQLIATNLAVSGMEAFIAYLDTYTTGERKTFAFTYPGIQDEQRTYTLPDGTEVSYQFIITDDDPAVVTVRAAAGTGELQRTKEIVYTINTGGGLSGNPYINEAIRVPVRGMEDQICGNLICIGKTIYNNVDRNPIKVGIGKVLDYFTEVVNQEIQTDLAGPGVICDNHCRNTSQVKTAIESAWENTAYNPLVMRFTNDIELVDFSETYGTAERPVILIFEGDVTTINNFSLEITGNLYFRKAFTSKNYLVITLHQANGSYGNLYAEGNVTAENDLTIVGANRIYAKNLTVQNDGEIQGNTLIVAETLDIKNNTDLNITQDIITGSIQTHTNSTFNATAGDFYVENSITSHNHLTINSGGVIAVGGEVSMGQHGQLNTSGTGTTTFPIITEPSWNPTDEDADGPGGGGSWGWNPTRQ